MINLNRKILIGLILSILVISCGGGGGSDSPSSSGGGPLSGEVAITGSFPGQTYAKANWLDRMFSMFAKNAYATALAVSKVLIFTAEAYSYEISEVIDGYFTVNVPRSNPIGMIFLGSSDEYIGYLYLDTNIASLPMSRVDGAVATIDLGDLSSSGLMIQPSNNPFDGEISLSDEELAAYAQFNAIFAELIKNPDVDGNGIIDILENKRHFMEIGYGIYGGRFVNFALTPTIDPKVTSYQLHFFTTVDVCPGHDENVYLEGPAGSPFAGKPAIERVDVGSYCTHRDYVDATAGFEPPYSGQYILEYPDRSFTFQMPDQSGIVDNMILIVPTVSLNENETINKISWEYRLATGSGQPLNPESIITQIQITISDWEYSPQGLFSSSLIFSTSTTEIDLSDEQIVWNDASSVNASYYDTFGNSYVMMWGRVSE